MPELIAGGFFIGIAIEFYSQLIIFCLQTQNLVPISLFFGVKCRNPNPSFDFCGVLISF
ncbi:hypothetical protein IHE45_15G045700 [Dioscorea alata]|uniref:Uncharacterized protein n=2 Tax=Dioscorea alata TaxID=55571 RepID=A0ACB7UL86_DIOAL|nr:hypothetical protein IHE45_15G045700 [Dioscorea alata]KAH7661172.1 hypothetical protein IHE45_15G045700 [Dioscorea alata]